MSTRTALHIIEAVADHEKFAPELGQIRLQDVLQNTEPLPVRHMVQAGWRVMSGVNVFREPYSNIPEVLRAYDKFASIDEQVRAHLDFSDALSDKEKQHAHEVWSQDADTICEIAGRLSILGVYLREQRGLSIIKARDKQHKLHKFKLGPYINVKIGLNTLTSNVLNRLQHDPEQVVLSPEAQASRVAAKGNPKAHQTPEI